MTLIKSLMLGSAAGIVAIASAQAADLPTKKGAPAAQYVKICTITAGGAPITGFVLPGSDTCLRISGYITGQFEAGNLKNAATVAGVTPNSTNGRDSFGWTTRGNLTLDAVSNTAAGPLLGHVEYQFNHGVGFDNAGTGGSDGGLNRAYVTWAGITAGKANSFFSFTGGGQAWANIFSPDRQGFNQPDLLAYTASFGGGFSATVSIESNEGTAGNAAAGGNSVGIIGGGYQGFRAPDVVLNLSLSQGWGSAGISGEWHTPRATNGAQSANVNGFALDAGVKFNLPTLGAGDWIILTGAWSKNAYWDSGIPDGMWGENGAVNGNGLGFAVGDLAFNPNGSTASPTAWSLTAIGNFALNSQFSVGPEISYAQASWSGATSTAATGVWNSKSWIAGIVAHYDPAPGLDFEFELLYQNTTNSRIGAGASLPGSDGFAGRFEITRSF